MPIRQIPGANPALEVAEKIEETADATPTFIRPRMLTVASTKVVHDIAERLKDAKPLKKLEKMASAE